MRDEAQIFWQQFPELADCRRQEWRDASAQIRAVHLPAGTTVFHAGDVCQHYVIVRHGSVCVRRYADNGREIVLYRVGDGQTCALTTSCLMAQEAYPAEGVTETEVDALLLPARAFQMALQLSEHFRRFVFQSFGARLGELIALVESVALRRIDVRLAERLLELADASGRDAEIHKTHQELAAELGTAREVVSRHLKDFERRGWIQSGRANLRLIAPDQMRELLRTDV